MVRYMSVLMEMHFLKTRLILVLKVISDSVHFKIVNPH